MSILSKLTALITAGNTKTGKSEDNLTDVVQDLIDGYGGGGSATLQTKSVSYTPSTSAQVTPDPGYDGLEAVEITVNAMPTGTEGTPTATKGAVSNHSVTVTPSVTNSAGYISGGTHSGQGVQVSASELVSGTKSITENGTDIDVTNFEKVDVAVSGGGGGYTADEIVKSAGISGRFEVHTATNNIRQYALTNCKGITSFFSDSIYNLPRNFFDTCTALETAVIASSNLEYKTAVNCFGSCTSLESVDITNTRDISSSAFNGATSLAMLVLRRSDAISALSNINAFNNTPFASGQSGGNLYVYADQIADYQAASNWSTILGYANNQIKSIESTHTDPNAPIDLTIYYADGTPIS